MATARERLNYLSTSLHLNSLSLVESQDQVLLGFKSFKSCGNIFQVAPCRPTSLDTTYTVGPKRTPAPTSPSNPVPRGNRAAELRKKSLTKTGANSSSSREVRLTFVLVLGIFLSSGQISCKQQKKIRPRWSPKRDKIDQRLRLQAGGGDSERGGAQGCNWGALL